MVTSCSWEGTHPTRLRSALSDAPEGRAPEGPERPSGRRSTPPTSKHSPNLASKRSPAAPLRNCGQSRRRPPAARPSGCTYGAPVRGPARIENSRSIPRAASLLPTRRETLPAPGLRPTTAVNTRRVLSERRRRFPQVLQDDEGGLRRETYRTAVSGDTKLRSTGCWGGGWSMTSRRCWGTSRGSVPG